MAVAAMAAAAMAVADSSTGTPTMPRSAATLRRRAAAQRDREVDDERRRPQNSTGNLMRMYNDDTPGVKVDPVVVLVGSLLFIASVFLLHIVGRLTR
ncbi:hypothetical protein CXG81DRAFT_26430 [Caulochytrium protostelioides]|uniref:Protein transport protein Sec61 subunit beta n=1 Tax=Caulochytrium protostelioides TaxID=1555241 RepID=A0A4P9X7H2_9FUNG|nr:hypothetical protein CXG81DRAFT_26430 [Caulochytrium protostelioides]|eukprot:RKP00891.1 hypothetical protein CXG81DRAFT_26430 [Caulochytrium protostelioides]